MKKSLKLKKEYEKCNYCKWVIHHSDGWPPCCGLKMCLVDLNKKCKDFKFLGAY